MLVLDIVIPRSANADNHRSSEPYDPYIPSGSAGAGPSSGAATQGQGGPQNKKVRFTAFWWRAVVESDSYRSPTSKLRLTLRSILCTRTLQRLLSVASASTPFRTRLVSSLRANVGPLANPHRQPCRVSTGLSPWRKPCEEADVVRALTAPPRLSAHDLRWKDMKMRIIIAVGIAILIVIIVVPIVKS